MAQKAIIYITATVSDETSSDGLYTDIENVIQLNDGKVDGFSIVLEEV